MTPEEREHSQTLVYQLLPSRYGMNPDDLRRADAIEIVIGQGAKPGGGGMLLGQKISDRVAEMRDLPEGIDQRSACRHPDWTGPDDLEIKIGELREITDWEKPIFVKIGASRPYFDVALAVKAGADVVVLDGMQGGTAATQDVFIEHVGIPMLAAIPQAVEALQELGMHREVQLVVSGGIRSGADVAKALALGADAVSIGVAALIALGDNAPALAEEYAEDRHGARLLRRLARGPRPGRHLHAGGRAGGALRPRAGRPPARQLPAHDGARDADARARLRQVARPQPRARGPRRADGRGRRDGARAARRHELDPRHRRPSSLRFLYLFVEDPARMSFVLTCPNCGVREVTDFGFGGEVSPRPRERPRSARAQHLQLLPPQRRGRAARVVVPPLRLPRLVRRRARHAHERGAAGRAAARRRDRRRA